MFESVFAIIMGVLNSPWFGPFLAFVLGNFSGQFAVFHKLWRYVMFARERMDDLERVIDAVDAVLKSNGVIPADMPKLTKEDVQSVMKGETSPLLIAQEQKVKLANLHNGNKVA